MKQQQTIPFFSVETPFEAVYKNSSTSFPVKPHTHNALELYFTLTDLPDVLLNDTVSGVTRGSLIIIPPHCVHQLFHEIDVTYERYIITINSSWLYAVLDRNPQLMSYALPGAQPVIVPFQAHNEAKLRAKLDTYINRPASNPSLSEYAEFFSLLALMDSLITDGLHHKRNNALSISTSQEHVNEIIAFINSHITEPLTLNSIAEAFFLNKDYLGRLFKSHTQATIGHYIAIQRASLAQSMLSEGQSVAQVQEKLGFSSYAYFFKFFKKMTGLSPSQFRKDTILPR